MRLLTLGADLALVLGLEARLMVLRTLLVTRGSLKIKKVAEDPRRVTHALLVVALVAAGW